MMFRNIFKKRYQLINRLIGDQTRTVLDIGCSNGVFLDLFKEAGLETWGVEPSKNAFIAKSKGHKILNDYFEKAKLPEKYFDLIIMNHTLEHMNGPVDILKKVNRLLKKDGILFVDVPNAGGLGARVLGKKWPYLLPDEHRHQFTKESLSMIFKKAGFGIVYFESRSGIFEYANPAQELWESLTTLKKRFITDILTIPYSLIVTVINMGDSMSLIGKKI